MKRQLSNKETATIMFALESVAQDSDQLDQDSKDAMRNLSDELAQNDVWLTPHGEELAGS